MVEHVHGRREQHTLIGLAGAPGDDFGEKRFPDAGIADDDDVGAMVDEVEIHQVKDAALHLKTAFVMVELEAIAIEQRAPMRAERKRRSTARERRASSSISTSDSSAAARLRFCLDVSVRS